MPLEADALVDRDRLKRQLAWWRAGAILVAAALVLLAAARAGLIPGRDHVARLSVTGVLHEDPVREEALEHIAKDGSVKALIVRLDSPGGTVVGGESLFRALRAVAEAKPVVTVMGTTAASAGYMVALGADHIVAHEGSLTGSIGVLLQTADVTELLKKLGVKPEAIKSAPLKAVPNPFEPLTKEGREATQVVVRDIYAMFVDMVASRRNLDRRTALALADGRVFTGRQALESKLVDALGGESQARAWLSEARGVDRSLPVRDVELDHGDGVTGAFLSALAGKTSFVERLTLDGLVSLWHVGGNRP